ncbi:MAG: vWA domain-containing protein [Anaerolineales bacterium]
MSFLAPLAFALLLLIPVVIAMYLLKLRRTEQRVSSVYLWQRMVRDVEANAPWQRLRRNLLLLLQILFLLALILALARPFVWAEGSGSQATILIVDTSASMAATDASPNRLDAAKIQARRIVDDMPDDARVTVIAAGSGARVLVAATQDRRQAYLAIDALQVQPGGSNMESALELASAIAARQPDTEIVVLSDGNVDLPERLAIQGQARYLPVGTQGDNQAISLLSVERAADGSGLTAFAQVSSFAGPEAGTAQRRISFYADGQLQQAFDLEIQPGSQQAVLAPGIPETTQVIEASLNGEDLLPLDDTAWVVNRPIDPIAATLVSQGNRFLETGLNLLPGVELTSIRPEDWEAAPGDASGGLTIFDTYVPITRTLPAESVLFIGPLRSTEIFTVTGQVEAPELLPAATDDPLLADLVDLDSINVLDAARLATPDWGRVVITSGTAADQAEGPAPMLLRGEVNGQRVAALAFDIRRSDLPLQISFPILLSNLVGWLAPSEVQVPAGAVPGETLSFVLPDDVGDIRLIYPDGSSTPLELQSGRVITPELNQLGVYQVRYGADESAVFAVNQFSPQESDIQPAGQLQLSGLASGQTEGSPQQARRESWRLLVWIGLILLMAEWLVYQRATLQRIYDRMRARFNPASENDGRSHLRPYR